MKLPGVSSCVDARTLGAKDIAVSIIGRRTLTAEQRFWFQTQVTPSCWNWRGGKTTKGGYGRLRIAGRKTVAARFSFELHYGPIPQGLLGCHTCDNRACVNPEHLFLGTSSDNAKDCVAKGRSYAPKLTEANIDVIKLAYSTGETQSSIALRFNVDRTTIGRVIRKQTWAHV